MGRELAGVRFQSSGMFPTAGGRIIDTEIGLVRPGRHAGRLETTLLVLGRMAVRRRADGDHRIERFGPLYADLEDELDEN